MPTSAFASKTSGGNAGGLGAALSTDGEALSGDALSVDAFSAGAFSGTAFTFLATGRVGLMARFAATFSGEGGGISVDAAGGSADDTAGCNADGSKCARVDGVVGTEGSTLESRAGTRPHRSTAYRMATMAIAVMANAALFHATVVFFRTTVLFTATVLSRAIVLISGDATIGTFDRATPSRASSEAVSRAVRSGTARVACFSADRNSAAV